MEGQTSFMTPWEARGQDLSRVRMPEAPLFVRDILEVSRRSVAQEAEHPRVIDGQLVLEIGGTTLQSTVEDPRE